MPVTGLDAPWTSFRMWLFREIIVGDAFKWLTRGNGFNQDQDRTEIDRTEILAPPGCVYTSNLLSASAYR